MTKPLEIENAKYEGPRPSKWIRTLLVGLVGIGFADLLVLNLWAVPKLITTTDMRAAERAERDSPAVDPVQPRVGSAEQSVRLAEPAEERAEPAPAQRPPQDSQALIAQQAQLQARSAQDAAEDLAARAQVGDVDAIEAAEVAEAVASHRAAPVVRPEAELADRAGEPDGAPNAVGGTADGRPTVRVFFSLGNFAIGPNARASLEQALPQLTADDQAIEVIGSADPTGSELINDTLSDARAEAVAAWLVEHGVVATRIHARGIGNTGAVGSSLDRRVDILLGGSR